VRPRRRGNPESSAAGEAIATKDIVDNGKFQEGLSKVIDGTVQCLNASVWAKAK